MHSTLGSVDDDAAKEFHEILPEIMRHIDTATIEGYRITGSSPEIRNALIIGVKGERLRPDAVRIEQHRCRPANRPDSILLRRRAADRGDPQSTGWRSNPSTASVDR